MSRFLVSAASIFALVITSLFMPQSADARRCEERMPLTLLSLYRTSDAIYVGRYDKDVDGEVTEETGDYRAVTVKRHFSISSALKGESRKLITIEDTEYRYKNVDVAAESQSEHGEDEYGEIAKPGDSVLLFVAKDTATGELSLTEMSDGIKKMTPEKLSAYEARIKDLKGILSTKKPKYGQLVDWMIRTAENPLTRWEGTFELLKSFENMDWQDERAKQEKEKPSSEIEAESEEYVPETPKEFETGDPGFARNVTNAQKTALTNILLGRDSPKKDENGNDAAQPMAHGDIELIELVKRWGDSRVASRLLEQLKGSRSDADVSADLMRSIAAIFQDDELTTVSEAYSSIRWESDEDEVRVEDLAEPAGPAVTEAETAANVTETVVDNAATSDATSGKTRTKRTYADLRAELTGKFVARADVLMAKEQNKKMAKLNR